MIEYSFSVDSKIDDNLTDAFIAECGNGQLNVDFAISEWLQCLKTLPGVVDAQYSSSRTHLQFENESYLSMFLLRWS